MNNVKEIIKKFDIDELPNSTFERRKTISKWMKELSALSPSLPKETMVEIYTAMSDKFSTLENQEQENECYDDAFEASNASLYFAELTYQLDDSNFKIYVDKLISHALWGIMFVSGGPAYHDKAIEIVESQYKQNPNNQNALIAARVHFKMACRCYDGTYEFMKYRVKDELYETSKFLTLVKYPNLPDFIEYMSMKCQLNKEDGRVKATRALHDKDIADFHESPCGTHTTESLYVMLDFCEIDKYIESSFVSTSLLKDIYEWNSDINAPAFTLKRYRGDCCEGEPAYSITIYNSGNWDIEGIAVNPNDGKNYQYSLSFKDEDDEFYVDSLVDAIKHMFNSFIR